MSGTHFDPVSVSFNYEAPLTSDESELDRLREQVAAFIEAEARLREFESENAGLFDNLGGVVIGGIPEIFSDSDALARWQQLREARDQALQVLAEASVSKGAQGQMLTELDSYSGETTFEQAAAQVAAQTLSGTPPEAQADRSDVKDFLTAGQDPMSKLHPHDGLQDKLEATDAVEKKGFSGGVQLEVLPLEPDLPL